MNKFSKVPPFSTILYWLKKKGRARQILSGGLATIVSTGGSLCIKLLSSAILSRLLLPEAFGLLSIVSLVLTAMTMLSDVGISTAIVRSKYFNNPRFLNTAWTMSILRGFGLWIVLCLLSTPIAYLYSTPELASMLCVAGVIFPIAGATSTKVAVKRREIELSKLAVIEIACQLFSLVVTIVAALTLRSAWAFIIGWIAGDSARVILGHSQLQGFRNKVEFDQTFAKQLFHFGIWIFLATSAGFLAFHGEKLVLSGALETSDFGLYSIASNFAAIPVNLSETLFYSLLFPIYSQLNSIDNAVDARRARQLRNSLTLVLIFMSLGMAIFAIPVINILLDPKFAAAGPLATLILLCSIPRIIIRGAAFVMLARGDSRAYAVWIMSVGLSQLAICYPAANSYGVSGAVVAQAASYVVSYPVFAFYCRKCVKWDPLFDLPLLVGAGLMILLGLHLLNIDQITT